MVANCACLSSFPSDLITCHSRESENRLFQTLTSLGFHFSVNGNYLRNQKRLIPIDKFRFVVD